MGFDPRRWRPPAGSRPVTANVESLLAENEALRREVRALRLQLELLQAGRYQPGPEESRRGGRGQGSHSRVSQGRGPLVSAPMVERWGEAMALHPSWSTLRIGPPGGLRGLIEELRSHGWNPALSLEEELDRRLPGLGADLAVALRGPHSRIRWAVRAAFALYGPRAIEWLSEEPRRVVEELLRRLERLEQRQSRAAEPGFTGRAGNPGASRRRGTRTANHSQAWNEGAGAGSGDRSDRRSGGGTGSGRSGTGTQGTGAHRSGANRAEGNGTAGNGRTGQSGARQRPAAEPDPHQQALRLLGLESGASLQAIKRAYRRLAKAHHPDLGGDAEAFHRLDSAYRLLIR